jgi:catechol 2,3-dioxygenase-like lactoylglutathione lyase family enzyme
MIEVKRIRHASFTTADIEQQIEYYQGIIGLGIVERKPVVRCSLPNWRAHTRYRAGGVRCKAMAFEISPGVELGNVSKQPAARHKI